MREKSYKLSYLFLVLRVRNLAPKKQVTATLKKQQKEKKPRGIGTKYARTCVMSVSTFCRNYVLKCDHN